MANDHPESIRRDRARLLDQRLQLSRGATFPASRRMASHPMAHSTRQKRATCARPVLHLVADSWAWHQDGPGELRKRHPVDRGRGLRYSCPPSDQGRCSRNRVGVELLYPSRRRRWIRRRYRFALPRRVDACGAVAGSQRRAGGGSAGCRNGRADCRLRDRRGQRRRTRACQHRRPATASGQRDRYDPRAISRGAGQSRRKAGSCCWHEPERRGRGLEVTSWWQHLGYLVTHEEENEWTRSIGPGVREIRLRKELLTE
jgi:hypothetical protein